MTKTVNKKMNKRKVKDIILQALTYIFSSFSMIGLIAIVVFIVGKGYKNFTWSYITGDYATEVHTISTDNSITPTTNTTSYTPGENEYFSAKWGLAFKQGTDQEGNNATFISYIDPNANINNWIDSSTNKKITLEKNSQITSLQLWSSNVASDDTEVYIVSGKNAKEVASAFDKGNYLVSMTIQKGGLGMRGSLISTLWLILIAMAIALPLGIGGAIYLAVYAKAGKLTNFLRSCIDMISGIPSIIFGLAGALIFIPMFGGQYSLLAGGFTLACMILPVIIKSTEESIKSIPHSMTLASLALGASESETTFKIILPNALPGILTSALLGVGRVIGESAALIYTAGAAIQDYILPTKGSASLAVHIWTLMQGENPNFAAACSVAILILIIVFILNILIKLISFRINRKKEGK